MRLVTFTSAGLFILAAAFILKKENNSPDASLYDRKWSLKKMHTASGKEEVTTAAFITFHKEKNSAGGNGSCNSFGSTVAIAGNTIRFSQLFSTKMYCEGVQLTEDLYFTLLEQANRFSVTDKKLELYKDKTVLLEFVSE